MKQIGNSKIELLENELKNVPESEALMDDLLWEYFQNPSLQGHPNRISLIKSYIKLYPTTTTAKSPIVQINPETSLEGYQSLENEWINLLSSNPDNAEITRSAANFYSLANPEKSLYVLHKFISKDPTNGDIWAARDLVSEISAHSYHKHWGYTALGHVALSNSDITTAIEHLKKSC